MFLRKTWVGLFLLTAAAAILRLWQIDSIPPGFHFDESFEGLEAWRILTDPTYRPIFIEGNFGVAPANAYANAGMFGIFALFGGEPGPTAMRVTAALFGVLGVLATWLAAGELRQLGAPRLTAAFPWLAAALLATTRWHIHFSRMGIEPILAPLVTATALWLLRAKRTTAAANSKYSGRHRLHAQRHQRHQQPHDNQIQHIERNLHPHAQRFRHR